LRSGAGTGVSPLAREDIDDFGTGYSSLASLRHLPIAQVKLDQSLFAEVPGDDAAEAIVGGSVEIAHGLGALVVAEGIETREQWRFAYTMGCDIAQGHLIGEPAPAEELLAFLDAPRLIPLSVA
jgi:diguanylate cyclase